MQDKIRKYIISSILFMSVEGIMPFIIKGVFHPIAFKDATFIFGIYTEVMLMFFGSIFILFALWDIVDYFTTIQTHQP